MSLSPIAVRRGRKQNRPGDRHRVLIIPAALIAILTVFIIAAACAPLYIPNPVHTPMMDSSGEVHLSGYIGTSTYSGNIAASVTDNVMLVGSYSFEPVSVPQRVAVDSQSAHVGHQFWEGGVGWYSRIGDGKIELITGFGAGTASAYWPRDDEATPGFYPGSGSIYRVDGSYRRLFVQGTIGGSTLPRKPGEWSPVSASIDGGFVVRGSYVWFSELEREGRPSTYPTALFVEPVAFVRIGDPSVQGEMQIGATVQIPTNDNLLRSSWFFFNIGLHLTLERLW